ncbi:PREDICTED: PRAME family member 12-like [Galeopterus variegatus]|uniref:PRAME family member 12-like n=1 Tax=Galeopterus variegatus TaxID=482537 RepID=A0ABM0RS39_GALVR|nr:PREDICTED: PRAME family member 12-like [Galeopterus variegatus]
MSIRAPSRLLELATQSLLRDEALAISALEELPTELFPPLFMQAFAGRHRETLKAMVQAWPFTRLPLGSLMKTPHLETLQAVLEGLDVLLAQKVRPRRWKLQVLDFRNVDRNFWRIWSGARALGCSPKSTIKKQTAEDCPRTGTKQPLKVSVDLCLKETALDAFHTCLLLWVKQRGSSLHLCCKKLRTFEMPVPSIRMVLNVVELGCLQELELKCGCSLLALAGFAPHLGQMSHLRKLALSHIYVPACIFLEDKVQLVTQFTSQFLRLNYLQKLSMDSVFFLEGHLNQVLWYVKTPLETLSITHCLLSESDLKHLSWCPSTRQLKDLDLSGVRLTNLRLEPLQVLLENVAASLVTLSLEDCGIVDPQLSAILPALSSCTQLTTVIFCGNPVSMAALENLLRHTARLSRLRLGLFPAPRESYDARGSIHRGRFAQLCAELIQMLRGLEQPGRVLFRTTPCPHCGNCAFYDTKPSQCHCGIPA